jgi:hypothetical protein
MKRNNGEMQADRLDAVEAHLANALRRVTPRKAFVSRLKQRIHIPERQEIALRLRDWDRLLLVFGGVFSGALVILTIARALFHLFGRRHLA